MMNRKLPKRRLLEKLKINAIRLSKLLIKKVAEVKLRPIKWDRCSITWTSKWMTKKCIKSFPISTRKTPVKSNTLHLSKRLLQEKWKEEYKVMKLSYSMHMLPWVVKLMVVVVLMLVSWFRQSKKNSKWRLISRSSLRKSMRMVQVKLNSMNSKLYYNQMHDQYKSKSILDTDK